MYIFATQPSKQARATSNPAGAREIEAAKGEVFIHPIQILAASSGADAAALGAYETGGRPDYEQVTSLPALQP